MPDENGEPWDFSRPSRRIKAEKLLDEQMPTLLVGTPVCTAFSTWQYINNKKRDPKIVESEQKVGARSSCMDVQAVSQADLRG